MSDTKAKQTISLIISLIIFIGFCDLVAGNDGENYKKEVEVIEYIKNNVYPVNIAESRTGFEDLRFISKIVGNAEIVCLGESRHDIHEQFLLKFRMIRYLVEELDFRTFILEGSFPYAELINNYLKAGEGDISEIMSEMPGWFIWDTEEIYDIIVWMREYNQDRNSDDKLQFYGIDIVSPAYGINEIFEYLRTVDPDSVDFYQAEDYALDVIEDNFWPNTQRGYKAITQDRKEALSKNYESLYNLILQNKDSYIQKSSIENYSWILQLSRNAQEANKMFSTETRLEMGLHRDNAMAANVEWIISNSEKRSKTIIWAHNIHIASDSVTMTGEEGIIHGMGYLLKKRYKEKLISIGGLYNRGEYVEWGRKFPPSDNSTLDGLFAQAGIPAFIFDLQNIDNKIVSNRFAQISIMHGQEFEMTCVPVKSFDALYYIDSISRTTPREKSSLKFKEMK
ncbi:MAG: erythromycin esterase family protein [Candidatus Stygibacter frigidus]|nr:erythromycin esterase family protein [Candidatus Stygibacter frigidus]